MLMPSARSSGWWSGLGLAAALACLVSLFACSNTYTDPAAEATTAANGDAIRAALFRYQGDNNGTLPDKLDELVPKYLPAVPPALIGFKQWSYGRQTWGTKQPDTFDLSVGIHENSGIFDNPTVLFVYTEGKWQKKEYKS